MWVCKLDEWFSCRVLMAGVLGCHGLLSIHGFAGAPAPDNGITADWRARHPEWTTVWTVDLAGNFEANCVDLAFPTGKNGFYRLRLVSSDP
jgi:hypothetical protein